MIGRIEQVQSCLEASHRNRSIDKCLSDEGGSAGGAVGTKKLGTATHLTIKGNDWAFDRSGLPFKVGDGLGRRKEGATQPK